MVPKVISDAGYTAVGLSVLAIQQVQRRQRTSRARLDQQVATARSGVRSAVGTVRSTVEPLAAKVQPSISTLLDRLPSVPGPLGGVIDSGRQRLEAVLTPTRKAAG